MAEEAKYMTEEEKIQKQYDRLIAARNYHYDNLNKWLRTFYVIIGALFVAFYTVYPEDEAIIVAIAGYAVTIAALLSGKGYSYWETNWIMIIHHFEKVNFKPKDERVYSVFANKDTNNEIDRIESGANVSTTKVALKTTAFIAILWGTICFYMGTNILVRYNAANPSQLKIVVGAFIVSYILTKILLVSIDNIQSDMQNLDNMGLTKENMNQPQREEE